MLTFRTTVKEAKEIRDLLWEIKVFYNDKSANIIKDALTKMLEDKIQKRRELL